MKQLLKALSLTALLCAAFTQASHLDCNSYQVNVGPTFNFARYKFGNLSKTQGYLAGIHADIEHDHACGLHSKLKFDGRWNAGFVAGQNDRKAKIRDFRPEWNLGYNFTFGNCDTFTLTPITGVGFIYLSTKLSTEAVTRNYYNVYVPVGLEGNWMVCENCFDIGLSAEYRIDAWSRIKVKTPDLGSTSKLKLKRTQGVLVEMPMTWHHDNCNDIDWHTKVVPYFDWNRFGQTKAENSNNIPVPTTKVQQWYLGLHVDVGINF